MQATRRHEYDKGNLISVIKWIQTQLTKGWQALCHQFKYKSLQVKPCSDTFHWLRLSMASCSFVFVGLFFLRDDFHGQKNPTETKRCQLTGRKERGAHFVRLFERGNQGSMWVFSTSLHQISPGHEFCLEKQKGSFVFLREAVRRRPSLPGLTLSCRLEVGCPDLTCLWCVGFWDSTSE